MPKGKNNPLMKKKEKRKFFQYTEEALKQALQEIRKNNVGIRQASRMYNVPRATIQDRLHARVSESKVRKTGPEPVLTIEGENRIAKWVVDIAKCGFPLKKIDLMETVQKIIKDSGKKTIFKNGKPGEKWYLNFLKRHPEISVREAEAVNKARAVVTEEQIRAWFSDLQDFVKENKLENIFNNADRVLNGDEAGFALCPKTGKVLAPKGFKNVYTVKMGNEKENLTVLVVFTASGKICPPLVVFPYVRPPRAIIDSMPDNWVLGRSETGWMKADVFFEYIANNFNKWLLDSRIEKPVILFIDGHKSHMTMPLSQFCEDNGIILYALPPNTTHMLQPADVSVFKPLKQGWKDTVRAWQRKPENVNSSVTKANFCALFETALTNLDMTKMIENGFRKCGLVPLNPNNVDYSKCIKNTLEKQTYSSETNFEEVNVEECRVAEKVMRKIKNKLISHGINYEVVIDEIKILEDYCKNTTTAADNKNETPAQFIEITDQDSLNNNLEDHHSIPEVGTIVSMDDLSIIPVHKILANREGTLPVGSGEFQATGIDTSLPLIIIEVTDQIGDIHKGVKERESITNSKEVKEGPTCAINVKEKQEMEYENTVTKDRNKIIKNNDHKEKNRDGIDKDTTNQQIQVKEKNREKNDIGTIEFNNVENREKEVYYNEKQTKNENMQKENYIVENNIENVNKKIKILDHQILKPITINVIQEHLTFPTPISKANVREQQKPKLPSAISSKEYREILENREIEKKTKLEEAKRKREERKAAKEEKQKEIKKKKLEKTKLKESNNNTKGTREEKTLGTNNSESKEIITCALCDEELISDVEDEDDKNIGCDHCSRWYHLKCTEFIGIPYAEVAQKEYRCDCCS